MSTVTAQMLVGTAHPNHGGINPTHALYLAENSRPVWTLVGTNLRRGGRGRMREFIWIPTTENMLEDGLVMVGVHVLKDPQIVQLAERFGLLEKSTVEVYRDLGVDTRELLYEASRQVQARYKVILTVLDGSSIAKQLPVLERHAMDIEVCVPQFLRAYSSWSDTTDASGSLNMRFLGV